MRSSSVTLFSLMPCGLAAHFFTHSGAQLRLAFIAKKLLNKTLDRIAPKIYWESMLNYR